MINPFTWLLNLTVKILHKNDFAPYTCSSENALGKSDARIRLQGNLNVKVYCNLAESFARFNASLNKLKSS